jgi:hypothetical protein
MAHSAILPRAFQPRAGFESAKKAIASREVRVIAKRVDSARKNVSVEVVVRGLEQRGG